MRRVEFHRVEARLLDTPSRVRELIHHFEHFFGRHRADGLSLFLRVGIDDLVSRRPRELEHHVVCAHRVVARNRALPAGVLQLHGAFRAIAVHGACQSGETRNIVVRVRHEAGHGRAARRAVRRGRADDHETRATLGDFAVVVDVPVTDAAVRVGRAYVRWHMANAVGNEHVADLNRFKQMRVC